MRIYLNKDVRQAATERMEWLFNEFENVVVCFSGGKDSTVTLNIALEVAEKLNRLPLKVMFLDQEAEWQTVIDYIREVMDDPRVDPIWLQIPIKLFNATSAKESWLYCWEEGEELIRLKHLTGFSKLFEDVEYKKAWTTKKQILAKKAEREKNKE